MQIQIPVTLVMKMNMGKGNPVLVQLYAPANSISRETVSLAQMEQIVAHVRSQKKKLKRHPLRF